MKIFGYCRVSTAQQNLERQTRNILKIYPNAEIFSDKWTGTNSNRPKWKSLLKKVREGDTIVFDSVSRMSRTADEGFQTYKELFNRGITLIFLKEPYVNTETYKQAMERQLETISTTGDSATDKLLSTIMTAIQEYQFTLAERQIQLAFEQSEKEVKDLHQRTKEGIETARLNGKQIGQPKGAKLTTKKSIESKKLIQKYSKAFDGTLKDCECIKLIGISRNTYFKYKKELIDEMSKE